MKTIEEIFALPTWEERISFIKRSRRTAQPDTPANTAAWFTARHRVNDKVFRKNMKTLVRDGYIDEKGKEFPPEFEQEEVARIALPIEQDIVNIHVAFTVGIEPELKVETEDNKELDLLRIMKKVYKENKLRFMNKREVRAWLAEQEVCEYWYRYEDKGGFWRKVWGKIASIAGISVKPKEKLRVQMWSPFKGDMLYPIYSDNGSDFLGIGRQYEYRKTDGTTVSCFMLVTDTEVYQVENQGGGYADSEGYPFRHGFSKIPVIYSYRPEALCANIKGARESLETLTSDFSDAIKMNFFPKLILEGDLANGGAENIGKSHLLKITNGGKAYYLDWHQTSDMVKTQMDNLLVRCYSMTNTPLIAFDQLKGTGQFPSGTAFECLFMATLFAVDRHWEEMGEFFQRRCNFLQSAIGDLLPSQKSVSETLEVEVVQHQYRIEDLAKKIADATNGVKGGVMSRKQGVMLVGVVDEFEDELELIEEDMQTDKETINNILLANGNKPLISHRESIVRMGWSKNADKTLEDIAEESKADLFEPTV